MYRPPDMLRWLPARIKELGRGPLSLEIFDTGVIFGFALQMMKNVCYDDNAMFNFVRHPLGRATYWES